MFPTGVSVAVVDFQFSLLREKCHPFKTGAIAKMKYGRCSPIFTLVTTNRNHQGDDYGKRHG